MSNPLHKLSVMRSPTRVTLLRYIASLGEARAGDLTRGPEHDISQSSVSQHLSCLFDAGLVNRRKDGRLSYYSIDQDGVQQVIEALEQLKAA